MAPRYTTVDAVQLALRAPTSSSSDAVSWSGSTFTAQINRVIETAERLIDQHCGWAFDPPAMDAETSERTVLASHFETEAVIPTPPVASPDDAVLRYTADGEDIDIEPHKWDWLHHGTEGLDAWRHIVLDRPRCGPIKLEALYGWPVTPSAVKDAAVQWAAHIFVQEANPLGAQAFEFGAIHVSAMPRGVAALLRDYRDTALDVFA